MITVRMLIDHFAAGMQPGDPCAVACIEPYMVCLGARMEQVRDCLAQFIDALPGQC